MTTLPVVDLRELAYDDPRREASYRAGMPRSAEASGMLTIHLVSTHWYFDGCDAGMRDELARCLQGLTALGRKETRRFESGERDWLPSLLVVDRYGATVVAVHRSVSTFIALDEVAPPLCLGVAA